MKFKKADLEILELKLNEFREILLEYARKWEPNEELVKRSQRKSKEINDIFRKNKLLR